MSKDDKHNENFDFSDPTKIWREGYDQFWKQAGQQWQQMAGNPQFLSVMNLAMEQSLMLTRRMHELIATTLKTMNVPTAQDIQAINMRLDQLTNRIAAMARQNSAANEVDNTVTTASDEPVKATKVSQTAKTVIGTPSRKSTPVAKASNTSKKAANARKSGAKSRAATKSTTAKSTLANKTNRLAKSGDDKE